MRLYILYLLILILVLFIAIIIFRIYAVNNVKPIFEDKQSIDVKIPTLTPKASIGVPAGKNNDYKVDWITVHDLKNIYLFSNIEENLTSYEAKSQKSCKYLVNAGFITQDGKHIGLFKNSNGELSSSIQSNTFNGYLIIKNGEKSSISYSEPFVSKIAIQSGPVLIFDGKPSSITIKSDEKARRVVAAVNKNNELIFLVIYSENSPLSGPKLEELPTILNDVENNTSLDFNEAINLDGGSHSAFLGRSVSLSELSIIGGYFCIR